MPRAPFRVIAAAPAEVLLAQAKQRARVTLPLWLALALGLAWLLAWWHHRTVTGCGRRADRPVAPASRGLDEPGPQDGLRGLGQFGGLIAALPAPVALIDEDGCVAATNPAFAALAAASGSVGRPLADWLADPTGNDWRNLPGEVRLAREVSVVGRGRGHHEVRFVARRIEAPTGGMVLTLQPDPDDGVAGRRPRSPAEATVAALVRAVEFRDPFMLGHTERLRRLSGDVAERLGLAEADRRTLDLAAALSQLGKIFVPDAILTKHGRHDAAEAKVMRAHVAHAARILEPLDFGLPVAETLLQMHERIDGSGYPRGLSGEAIGLPARILGVVDVYCARTATRSYRDRVSPGQALYHLANHPARYDPHVVAALAASAAEAERSGAGVLPHAAEPSTASDAAA